MPTCKKRALDAIIEGVNHQVVFLGIELRACGRADSALSHGTISPFLREMLFLAQHIWERLLLFVCLFEVWFLFVALAVKELTL